MYIYASIQFEALTVTEISVTGLPPAPIQLRKVIKLEHYLQKNKKVKFYAKRSDVMENGVWGGVPQRKYT